MIQLITQYVQKHGKVVVSTEMGKLLTGVFHDRLTPHAIVLTYLATCNFNVIRFPTRPDRSVDSDCQRRHDAVALLDSYSDQQIQTLKLELETITNQTQAILTSLFPTGRVKLQRAISPLKSHQYLTAKRKVDNVEMYPLFALAAQQAGLASITMDVDIVSGWSTSSLQRYGSLHLTREWPINDVLLVSNLLDSVLEDNEWLCINRNPRGLIEFPITDISLHDLTEEVTQKLEASKDVTRLAAELRAQATKAATERTLGFRPTPAWWDSETRLPDAGLLASLKSFWKVYKGRH